MTPNGALNTYTGGTNMRRILLTIAMLGMSCAFAAGIASVPAETVKADGNVEINETNFPDNNFRSWIEGQSFGEDGVLTEEEISKVDHIFLSHNGSNNLKGIEFFTALKSIDCSFNDLTSLDFSKNLALESIYCPYNKLTSIKVNNTLSGLDCSNNQLTSLDVSYVKSLKNLDFYNNQISSIDVSKNTNLVGFNCSNNKITSLDVSKNIKLKTLWCSDIPITSLDISKNTELGCLFCQNTQLVNLDVSKNTALTALYISANKFTSLDFSNNLKLTSIECQDNDLTKLILPKTESLEKLYCYHNKLKSIDISFNPDLVLVHEKGYDAGDVDDPDYYAFSYYSSDEGKDASLFYDYDTEIICNPDVYEIKADNLFPVCGKTTTLKALLNDKPIKENVVWESSDDTIAKVDANGKVTTKMAGTVTITATVAKKVLKCVITVLYKDVTKSKDFWYGPTNYMTALGVVKGYDKQTKFKPANKCTRAQMVTFLWRLKGSPEPKSNKCKFKDVKKTDYFFKAVVWGNEQHVVEGYKDGTFGPQKVCQRKHAVTFLWRLAGCPEDFNSRGCKFKDVKKSDYYYYPVIWASVGGVLEGYKDGTFRPEGNCLRRQMVTFLYRFKFNNWTYDAED